MTTYFVSNAGSNTAPYDTEAKAATALATIAAIPWAQGDIVKLSSTHTETAAAAITYTFPTTVSTSPLQLYSVTFNGSGTGAVASGATINVGASSSAFTLGTGYVYGYGITFKGGTNNNAACDLIVGVNTAVYAHHWESCSFFAPSANTGAQIAFGTAAPAAARYGSIQLTNCTLNNGAAKSILIGSAKVRATGLVLAGTNVTTVFDAVANTNAIDFEIKNSNLTGITWTNFFNAAGTLGGGHLLAYQCKMAGSFNFTTGALGNPEECDFRMVDCDASAEAYSYAYVSPTGTVLSTVAHLVSGSTGGEPGATTGATAFSLNLTSTGVSSYWFPLYGPNMIAFNGTTGVAGTTNIEIANFDSATFTNAEIWQQTTAKVTGSSPAATTDYSNRMATGLSSPANQPTSSATWSVGINSTQYLASGSYTPQAIGQISVQVCKGKANASESTGVDINPVWLVGASKEWAVLSNGDFVALPSAAAGGGMLLSTTFAQ